MFDVFTLTDYEGAIKVNSIDEARELSKTRYCWILDSRNDYSDFDFLWEPSPWESGQCHIWPSQHQENGGTYLVPKAGFTDKNYNHTEVMRLMSRTPPIVHIDHGNGFEPWRQPISNIREITKTRFINDYLGTLKRIVSKVEDDYMWVISSVCNYQDFDFTWHPSEWQDNMMHVFPSNEQKFGDTFYINVKEFKRQMHNLELLEWADNLCFRDDVTVQRKLPNIYLHQYDNQVDAIKSALFSKIEDPSGFNEPVALFSTTSLIKESSIPTLNLWRPETRAITPLDAGAARVLVPKEALTEVSEQLYDYPHVDKTHRSDYTCTPLDIMFLSNGEKCADEHCRHLMDVAPTSRVHRVDGVNGRLNAYRECAKRSRTDWFFVVYAKLKVDEDFDFNWQPDRMQQAKHYIFHAYNSITDDTYGHMAMIAFNKRLVLEHDGKGMDFSMHQEHTVVPILSGEAIYADDPWAAWRTAFREVIKLQMNDDMESTVRLGNWIKATDEWTAKGVQDAQEFYAINKDDVLKTYEWDFLRTYFNEKYGLIS